MNVSIKLDIDTAAIEKRRGLGASNKARVFLATTVARFCDKYVPMRQGTLKNTHQIASDGRQIVYSTPYAHYQYRGIVMRDDAGRAYYGHAPKHDTEEALSYHGAPMRGKEWDKRMMADHREDVIDSLAAYVGGKRQ